MRGPAHTGARRAGFDNTWLQRPSAKSLDVLGSQTKLSHFDAVAWNTRQRPDHFHDRPRPPHCIMHDRYL